MDVVDDCSLFPHVVRKGESLRSYDPWPVKHFANNHQFTGLLVAFIGIFVVYFLPRIVPAFRTVVGMPGI